MINKLRNNILHAAACILFTTIPAARAQTPNANGPAPQLTDAQMAQLIQALAAQSQANGVKSMTPAQTQMLIQTLMRQNQAAAAALTPAQNQAMLQALAAQSQALPSAGYTRMPGQPGMQGFMPGAAMQTALGPKKPGVPRVGVVEPKAQMGQGNSGANVAEPIRTTIEQYLSGPAVEVIPLNAMLPSQIEAEAKQLDCDYVLYASVSQKMNSGGMGFLKKAAPFTSMVPMVGMMGGAAGSMTGAMAGMAAGSAMSGAASVAGTVKAKAEVTFDYKLVVPGGAPVAGTTLKAKAKEDGQDVITPLIEQADEAILTELAKRK